MDGQIAAFSMSEKMAPQAGIEIIEKALRGQEAAMLAGLDFKVDALMNSNCEIIDAYCGHPIKEYYEGIKKAQVIYNTPHLDKAEVVIVNANAKANEATFAVNIGADHVLPGGEGLRHQTEDLVQRLAAGHLQKQGPGLPHVLFGGRGSGRQVRCGSGAGKSWMVVVHGLSV